MEKAIQNVYQFNKDKMKKILNEFLIKSGYNVDFNSENKILINKNDARFEILIFPSILILENEIIDLEIEKNLILTIPTGNNPGPYLKFYKIYAHKILLKNAFSWIIDVENEAVSPFVGYIKDEDLNSNFKSSEFAKYASRFLDMNVDEEF